jgi:hypothetical protein
MLPEEMSEYNIEGFVESMSSNTNSNDTQIDAIESQEIEETNKEYSFYLRNFFEKVTFLFELFFIQLFFRI